MIRQFKPLIAFSAGMLIISTANAQNLACDQQLVQCKQQIQHAVSRCQASARTHHHYCGSLQSLAEDTCYHHLNQCHLHQAHQALLAANHPSTHAVS